ncbi:hypothetical protein AAFF27_14240 [Xylophilus sp. GW821-FHT01B05]
MRRGIFLILIMLMALRGLTSGAMAASMPPMDHMDHGDHGAAHAMQAAHTASEDGHAHTDCGDCQVCHSAWLTADLAVPSAPPLPHAAPVTGRAAFASADLARQIKPPILRT